MEKFACMYLRLSREDGDSTESNSISNQRQIIKSYARDNDFKVVAEYVDDGFSGFRVIIVIEANSYVNTRSSRLLPKFKT